MITSFSHIYLPVRDLDESLDFYTQKLGFYLLRRWRHNGRDSAYVGLDAVLLELMLGEHTPVAEGRSETRLGLTVDDMTQTLADLRAAGVEVVREPWVSFTFWGAQAQIRDPNGYVISLRQWTAPDNPRFRAWQPLDGDTVRLA